MYRVFWLYSAQMELAEFWVDADSSTRAELTAAAAQLDRELERNPHLCGESRELNERILIIDSLVAQYSVDDEHHEVTVLSVNVYKYRPKG